MAQIRTIMQQMLRRLLSITVEEIRLQSLDIRRNKQIECSQLSRYTVNFHNITHILIIRTWQCKTYVHIKI